MTRPNLLAVSAVLLTVNVLNGLSRLLFGS
jgi:hypothetical protein